MVRKGKAFDKPGVNRIHQTEVRRVAVQLADRSAASTSALKVSLRSIVEDAEGLSVSRKGDAFKAIDEALKKLARNEDPLGALKPPPNCKVCHGQTGATHHFLCGGRSQNPAIDELRVRNVLMTELAGIWRAWQQLPAEVRASRPSIASTIAPPRRRRVCRSLNSTRPPAPQVQPPEPSTAQSTELLDSSGQQQQHSIQITTEGTVDLGAGVGAASTPSTPSGLLGCPSSDPASLPSGAEGSAAQHALVVAPTGGGDAAGLLANEIDAEIKIGMQDAAAMEALDTKSFESSATPFKPKVAEREAAWMRVELARIMQHVSPTALPLDVVNGRVELVKPLVERRGGESAAGGLRKRPTRCAPPPHSHSLPPPTLQARRSRAHGSPQLHPDSVVIDSRP